MEELDLLQEPTSSTTTTGAVERRPWSTDFDYLPSMESLDLVITGLAVAIFSFWASQWFIHLLSIMYGKCKLHCKIVSCSPESLPGVSILKPLTGIDPNLYTNLETFFNMAYPKYELLFCIEEDADPAVMVVRSLLDKYPKVDARLFVGAMKVGVNPKVNNMVQGYDSAKYDFILISDSGLRMKEDTLLDMVSAMGDKIGLVHQMPYVCDRDGFAAVLEKVYFGTQHAKIYLNADLLGINCVTGMSCLFRKEVVEQGGGLRTLGAYLAEDYYLAQMFIDRGWKVRVASKPALQNAGNYSVIAFQARMMRWTKLRTSLLPLTIFFEPISECLILGVASSWSVSHLFDWSALAFFLVHLLVWFLLDYILLLVVQGGSLPFTKLEYVMGWLFRESMSFSLMLRSHCMQLLTWRSRRYIIKWGGLGEEVKTPRSFV